MLSREVGQHTNGLDEGGPPWDRSRARCGSGNAGNASRKCRYSTVFNAKCSQPWRGWKGSPVSSGTGGRTPSTNSNHLGNTQPTSARDATHFTHDVQAGHLTTTIEPLQHGAHDLQVSLLHHKQAVSPTCPISGFSRYVLLRSQAAFYLGATTSWYSARMSPTGTSRIRLRHTKTSRSCAVANCKVRSGRTFRNQ